MELLLTALLAFGGGYYTGSTVEESYQVQLCKSATWELHKTNEALKAVNKKNNDKIQRLHNDQKRRLATSLVETEQALKVALHERDTYKTRLSDINSDYDSYSSRNVPNDYVVWWYNQDRDSRDSATLRFTGNTSLQTNLTTSTAKEDFGVVLTGDVFTWINEAYLANRKCNEQAFTYYQILETVKEQTEVLDDDET